MSDLGNASKLIIKKMGAKAKASLDLLYTSSGAESRILLNEQLKKLVFPVTGAISYTYQNGFFNINEIDTTVAVVDFELIPFASSLTRLAFPTDRRSHEYLSTLYKNKHDIDNICIGLDSR